jgi:hypothetical protein
METSAPIPPWRPTTTTMVWKMTSELSTEPIKSTTTRATTSHRTTLCLQPWNLINTATAMSATTDYSQGHEEDGEQESENYAS